MSSIDKLRAHRLEVVTRLDSLRALRGDFDLRLKAGVGRAEELEDIDKRILGAAHRLERILTDLVKAEESERIESEANAAEVKRLLEIEALELFVRYYAQVLETESARQQWFEAKARVPGGLDLPLLAIEAQAQWCADKLVELTGMTELPGTVEVADLAVAELGAASIS